MLVLISGFHSIKQQGAFQIPLSPLGRMLVLYRLYPTYISPKPWNTVNTVYNRPQKFAHFNRVGLNFMVDLN